MTTPQFISCNSCSKTVNRFEEICPYCGEDPGGYQDDIEVLEPAPTPPVTPPAMYRPLQSVALLIQLLLGLFAIGSVALLVTGWPYRNALLDLDAGRSLVPSSEAVLAEDRFVTAGMLLSVVSLVLAVAFIVWFWRAYSNLPALGASRRRRPGWAIGGWFIPIASYFIPYSIGAEIWAAGEKEGEHPNLEPVISWWALFFIMVVVRQVAFFAGTGDSAGEGAVASAVGVELVASAVGVAASFTAMRFVRLATNRQEEKAASRQLGAGWLPPGPIA